MEDQNDRHGDFDFRDFQAPPGYTLIGARVRGRKHKHEGTNCDDWFEVVRSGSWEVIAVSDGAGSCDLSRVGAKVSTQAATEFLGRKLANVDLDLPAELVAGLSPERDEQGVFRAPFLERLQGILHAAVSAAVEAVRQEAGRREIEVKMLSSTLRLAIHRQAGGVNESSLLMTCGVGDGMTAAIDTKGTLHLLGSEESGGKHSGETEFLTDARFVSPERLAAATFFLIGPLRAVMVMSDGVADPYFPNNPGMIRLYADLLLNRVLASGVDRDAAIKAKSEHASGFPDLDRYSYQVQTPVGLEEMMSARVRQSDLLANALQVQLDDLIKWPPDLLAAGALGDPMNEQFEGATTKERLRIWLESFYVRGEFDDRTLVILHREVRS